ncbi:MAG: zinc ribbon domain-containing protein, partial [Thermoplasmata archaeon]|nr:zinc ribbon domain-containing protein [Thermoplasmata archaeon]
LTVAYALGVQGTIDTANLIEVDSTDANYVDGKEFYHLAIIDDEGIYSHVYSLNFQGANTHSLNTTVALGPLVGDESASYGFYALIGIPSMFCNIGMLFVILVLLYWWIGTAKEKRAAWDIDLREKEAVLDDGDDAEEDDDSKPFTCDECGASVGVEDNFCPKCGERFDEEDDEESVDSSSPSEQVPLDDEELDEDKESLSQTSPEPAEEDSVTPSAEAEASSETPDPQEPAKDED